MCCRLVLLVVDVTTGITEEDARSRRLQRGDVPVMLVVIKVDAENRGSPHQFLTLGLRPWVVSAIHGRIGRAVRRGCRRAARGAGGERGYDPNIRDGIFSVRSSAVRTSAIDLFNRLGEERRSFTICPAPLATRSTRWSRPKTAARFVDTAVAPQSRDRRAVSTTASCAL